MNRSAMVKVYQIDERIRSGTFPNCRTLARELEVSRRTVERYIDALRDQMGAPLEYDHRRRGFYYRSSDFRLPPLALSPREIAGLQVAVHLLGLVAGSALEQPTRQLLEKLAAALPEGVSVGSQAPEGLSFGLTNLRGDQVQVASDLKLLQEAMATRRTARVLYYSAYRDAWRRRRIDVYHLHYRDGAWYAVIWCHWRRRVRILAVDRMRELELLPQGFRVRPDFDAAAYLSSAWRIEAGQPVTVSIRFAPAQARYIKEQRWHATQKLTEQPDGSVVMTVRVAGLAEMARWVLQFGGDAEVMAPPALRAMVAQAAADMMRVYGQAKETDPTGS